MAQLITQMGMVWRLPNKNYELLLNNIIRGEAYDLDDYGDCLGRVCCDVTDMKAQHAAMELEYYNNRKNKK